MEEMFVIMTISIGHLGILLFSNSYEKRTFMENFNVENIQPEPHFYEKHIRLKSFFLCCVSVVKGKTLWWKPSDCDLWRAFWKRKKLQLKWWYNVQSNKKPKQWNHTMERITINENNNNKIYKNPYYGNNTTEFFASEERNKIIEKKMLSTWIDPFKFDKKDWQWGKRNG